MKNSIKTTDCLIVGQGIAGTLFAHECDKNGRDFIVMDNGKHNASLTAAGMYNPVVLKRFTPVWQGLAQIQRARQMAVELDELLACQIDKPFDILRVFHNDNERQTWQKKATQSELNDLLDTTLYPAPKNSIYAPFGVGRVNHSGKIDLKQLLHNYRGYLQKTGRLRSEHIDYSHLTVKESCCQYGDIEAKHVVFCEGYGITANPFFNYLPLKGNKGEVLTIKIPNLHLSTAIKAGVLLMPLPEQGKDVYLLGATYNWTDKNDIPTEAAKTELLEKLCTLLPPEVHQRLEIIDHRAGMRPTVIDRRPLLGHHPNYPQLLVLNGLGTRGVMLGATMAPLLYDFMAQGMTLPPAVDIARFPPH